MPHDIIDNRELHLADAVGPLITESVRAYFAVGYVFLCGFKAIAYQREDGFPNGQRWAKLVAECNRQVRGPFPSLCLPT